METLGIDTLSLVLPTPAARCKMTCVSRHFMDLLRLAVGERKYEAVRWRILWKRRRHAVYLHINAPHMFRLIWRTCGTTKEVCIDTTSTFDVGRFEDGTVNFDLSGMPVRKSIYTKRGKLKSRALYDDEASLYFRRIDDRCQARIHMYGGAPPNGKVELWIVFAVPVCLYRNMLEMFSEEDRAVYNRPAITLA